MALGASCVRSSIRTLAITLAVPARQSEHSSNMGRSKTARLTGALKPVAVFSFPKNAGKVEVRRLLAHVAPLLYLSQESALIYIIKLILQNCQSRSSEVETGWRPVGREGREGRGCFPSGLIVLGPNATAARYAWSTPRFNDGITDNVLPTCDNQNRLVTTKSQHARCRSKCRSPQRE